MTTCTEKLLALFIAIVVAASANVAFGQRRVGMPRIFPTHRTESTDVSRHTGRVSSNSNVRQDPAGVLSPADLRAAELTMRARQALWHAQSPVQRAGESPQLDRRKRDVRRASDEVIAEPPDPQDGWTTQSPYDPNELGPSALWHGGQESVDETEVPSPLMDRWQIESEGELCQDELQDCLAIDGAHEGPTSISIFSGVQGFTNPINQSLGGSFGFHEGLNIGTPLPIFLDRGWGWQIGLRATQNNISGTGRSRLERHQTFFTTGVFRRTECGLQGGLVVDLLDDEWLDDVRLTQLRGEIGWRFATSSEWGYWFAGSGASDQATQTLTNPIRFTVTDVQGIYYRQPLWNYPNSTVRLLVGFSNDADGLVTADGLFPLTSRTSLTSSFSYLVPSEATGAGGAENEVWNIGLSLEFALGGSPGVSQYAPLFSVAHNGVFFVDAD